MFDRLQHFTLATFAVDSDEANDASRRRITRDRERNRVRHPRLGFLLGHVFFKRIVAPPVHVRASASAHGERGLDHGPAQGNAVHLRS